MDSLDKRALVLAREIVAETIYGKIGWGEAAAGVLAGKMDKLDHVQAAYAAILRTSELAAEFADRANGVGSPRRSYVGDALRFGTHLKKAPTHD